MARVTFGRAVILDPLRTLQVLCYGDTQWRHSHFAKFRGFLPRLPREEPGSLCLREHKATFARTYQITSLAVDIICIVGDLQYVTTRHDTSYCYGYVFRPRSAVCDGAIFFGVETELWRLFQAGKGDSYVHSPVATFFRHYSSIFKYQLFSRTTAEQSHTEQLHNAQRSECYGHL